MITPPNHEKRNANGRRRVAARILAPSLLIIAAFLLLSALAERESWTLAARAQASHDLLGRSAEAGAQPARSLTGTGGTGGVGLANGASSTPSPGCELQWNVVQAPDPGPGDTNFLQAVAAVSSFELWAVGNHYPGSFSRPLMEHFDGYTWAIEPSPSLSAGDHFLAAVSGSSPDDVWAVGYYEGDVGGPLRTLILHWNGVGVVAVPSPNVGEHNNLLHGVAAIAPNDVWAVGTYYNGSYLRTLTMHWDGVQWSVVPSPNLSSGNHELHAVTAVASNDIWAVGTAHVVSIQTLTMHWDGVQWSVVLSPNPGSSRELKDVVALATDDVWAVGRYRDPNDNHTLTIHWDGVQWSVVPSPTPQNQHVYLEGVAGLSSNDVWAVGYFTPYLAYTLILHWDGSAWTTVPSPSPGSIRSELYDVAALSPHDIWAVGHIDIGAYEGLIERYYDPCATPTVMPPTPVPSRTPTPTPTATPACVGWNIVASPNIGTLTNDLLGVSVVSAEDIWAVGTYREPNRYRTLITHWDGVQWSVAPSPNQGELDNVLYAVEAIGPHDIWAVGEYSSGTGTSRTLIVHWDGGQWSIAASPNGGTQQNAIYGVSGTSPNDVWAVGEYGAAGGVPGTLALHWDGAQWIVVPTPSPGTSYSVLQGVVAMPGSQAWAVGRYGPGGGVSFTLTLRWNGTAWSQVPSPNPGSSYNLLNGVDAVSPTDIWAVGQYSDEDYNDHTLTIHWNGSAWSEVPSPSPGYQEEELYAVSVIASDDAWAVGYYEDPTGRDLTLTMHWEGGGWEVIPSANGNSSYHALLAIDDVSPDELWAVGYQQYIPKTLVEHYVSCNLSTTTPTPLPSRTHTPTVPPQTLTPTHTPATPPPTVTPTVTQGTPQPPSSTSTPSTTPTTAPATSTRTATRTPSPWSTSTPAPSSTSIGEPTLTPTHFPTLTPTPVPTHCPTEFSDVLPGSTFYPFVRCMVCRGIVSGYQCGGPAEPCNPDEDPYFRPNNYVTRGQLAKIVSESTGFSDTIPPSQWTFTDVPYGSTFWLWVERLAGRQVMTGYACGQDPNEPCDGQHRPYFRSGAGATRGQLTKIVSNAAGFDDTIPLGQYTFTDVPPTHTFWLFVERLLLNRPGVMGGYPCGGVGEPCDTESRPYFRPGNLLTRGQTSKIVSNTFFPGCDPPRS
jgi:hypothetical protein